MLSTGYFNMGCFDIQIFKVSTLKEMEDTALDFAKTLKPGDVVAFKGTMGAGKTTFTRGIAKAFGAENEVSSPTFAIMNEYGISPAIHHYDMYRISGWDDLYSTGFFEDIENDNLILLIEWSENIAEFLPDEYIEIQILYGENQNERTVNIQKIKRGESVC